MHKMDLQTGTGETQEHLELMKLLLCQSDECPEMSKGKEPNLNHSSSANENSESQQPRIINVVPLNSNCSGDEDINLFDSTTVKNIIGTSLVPQLDMQTYSQPISSEKSLFGKPLKIKHQLYKENLTITEQSSFQHSSTVPMINTPPVVSQVPQLESVHFDDITQNLENVSSGNMDIMQPFGILNFETTDMEAVDDPAFSAAGLDLFAAGDMVASSEKDLVEVSTFCTIYEMVHTVESVIYDP